MTPAARALGARIRAGEPAAVAQVVGALRRQGGDVRATAKALGVGERTLYSWRDASPALAEAFGRGAMGRTGAAARATAARRK